MSRIAIRRTFSAAAALGVVLASEAHGPAEHDEERALPFLSIDAPTVAAAPMQKPGHSLPLQPQRRIEFDTDEGTWMSLDLSPDGNTIVFDLLGDLYSVAVKGGDAKALTRGLAFDTQPTFSPDGAWLAFLSDRSGAENLWVARADGAEPRQISFRDDYDTFISPAWSADGQSVYVSRHMAAVNATEVWKFALAGNGAGELSMPIRVSREEPRERWRSVLGVTPSPDGRYLYYAAHDGDTDFDRVPECTIRRRDLHTAAEEVIVAAPKSPRPDLSRGSAFRPAIAPDGRSLVYGARHDGRTGLRMLDLHTQQDRWLAFPVQQDALQAFAAQDFLPRYDFTPDGKALIFSADGKLRRLDIASGRIEAIPFRAQVAADVGPFLRVPIEQETGPVRARLIQGPVQSPDGTRLVFSALGFIYVMPLDGSAKAGRLTSGTTPEFQPSWSPDGRNIVYVTWTARDAGHVWTTAANGSGRPRRLSDTAAFYTNPTFSPDGGSVLAVRSSNVARTHSYMEYGSLRQGELVSLPAAGGIATVVAKGTLGGRPQFSTAPGRAYVNFADGLNSVAIDGSGRRPVLLAVGPGWYFAEGPAPVDDLKISPDGKWALAQIAQQLHVMAVPDPDGPAEKNIIDVSNPGVAHRKLTAVGADYFEWADGGRTITWAVGSTYYRRPLAAVALDAANALGGIADAPKPGERGVQAFHAPVTLPRDTPHGTVVLRGATAITLRGDEVIADADVVIVDDRIAAVGKLGQVRVPAGASIRDVSGKFIVPGFIDAHDHVADVRRGVLDLQTWGPLANLAYGVTTAFDPSTLSVDLLAYQDLLDTGQMIGSRIHSTGPALFSFNEFKSKDEVRAVVSRYADHYRLRNLKEYRTGNRRVRQWVAEVARELGMVPTTEGALSMKLDLTQIADGFAGSEHALTAVPLSRDVVELVARSKVSYTPTLMISNGGPQAQDYYIALARPHDDPKLNRFSPHYVIDIKTLQRPWRDDREYLFPRIAQGAAQIARAGGIVGMGSHGEMPGIGMHWEMRAYAAGGMTPLEVLCAATLGSAQAIGRHQQFGSLEPGKYADLVILDRDPLQDIANTLAIHQVMKNGRLYDGDTLDEVWPRQRPLPALWFWDDGPVVH